jgi:hypothetical protein
MGAGKRERGHADNLQDMADGARKKSTPETP